MGLDQSRAFDCQCRIVHSLVPPIVSRLCSLHRVELQANQPGDSFAGPVEIIA